MRQNCSSVLDHINLSNTIYKISSNNAYLLEGQCIITYCTILLITFQEYVIRTAKLNTNETTSIC